MPTLGISGEGPLSLAPESRVLLDGRIALACRRAARFDRPTLASLTVAIDPEFDASAAILTARHPNDRYFCLESSQLQLAALGQAATVTASGPDRFDAVTRDTRRLAATAVGGPARDDPSAPRASGPMWVGGFAFAPHGGMAPEWSSLEPALLVMPEISIARDGTQGRLTLNAVANPGDDADRLMERLEARLHTLQPASMPLLDPDPVGGTRVASAAPPQHFEAAVARATERIRAGELTKMVLAREVRVHAHSNFDAGAVFDGLRAGFPSCYCYLVGTPELAFVGASPELLVRREGQRLQTVALAGTRRRSADPAVDAHLGEQLMQSPKDREEQAIVTRRIARLLDPVSIWVAAAEEPSLVKVLNVQHLATPIRAQLNEAYSCVDLAGLLHPTPAVGGEPRERALELIPALEGLDRGWYAGPIGWMDLAEDGEFCVALRCALLRERIAHLFAGEGIVRDSVPADELTANEAKLQALLPLLS